MSDAPWRSDLVLTSEQVHDLVQRYTDIAVDDLSYLAEGWDFVNWLVNKEWVFRFPKRFDDSDTLLHEKRVLEWLDISIDHPRFEIWVDKSDRYDRPFAGYRFIEGTPIFEVEQEDCDVDAIAEQLGSILAELHRGSFKYPRSSEDPLVEWRDDALQRLSDLGDYLSSEQTNLLKQALQSYQIKKREGPLVPTHNDLSISHLLVDEQFNLSAIIDWADAATASRFVDFAGMWAWGGDPAIHAMLRHYIVEPNLSDLAHIRTHGLCYALETMNYGHQVNEPFTIDVAKRWILDRIDAGELPDVNKPL